MRLFGCEVCGQLLYFENTQCVRCGATLGYLPERNRLTALDPAGAEGVDAAAAPGQAPAQAMGAAPAAQAGSSSASDWLWRPRAAPETLQRFCDNARHDACNWLVPAEGEERLCLACRYNRTIPDLSDPERLAQWRKIEAAKRRAMYSFLRLGLPLVDRNQDPENGLAFDFLADAPDGGQKVMTGHDNGLITLALVEADDAERTRRRTAMGEPYRTLLGHFRHESGHYFWDRLVRDAGRLQQCRAVFGDDSQDYGAALQRHYEQGPPEDWQENFVSTYATAHPWEDFAETWAHYLHIVDTLEMARAFGIGIDPAVDRRDELTAEVDFDPHRATSIERLMESWVPLTAAVNSLNRCMGTPDLYPFVLSPAVVAKLGFIQALVHGQVPPDQG
ncbi:putative zinc-binding metallopeptidase [Pseudoroseomonas cervicalis]|uniref:zinc-binding metallopeptidase family protein n=1 Tax=Teichococcus cervicalis TaxID=204525 RepID=UPI0022F1B252|nr:putative zinc-binding peptidase [Pseudoroseomonas cervicalis]WBV44246.1 putative zinc-binding peptidase [Pseudoroseomonas cervicalis]